MEDLGLVVLELVVEGDLFVLAAAFGLLRIAGAMDCGGRREGSFSGVVVTIAMGGPSSRVVVIVDTSACISLSID